MVGGCLCLPSAELNSFSFLSFTEPFFFHALLTNLGPDLFFKTGSHCIALIVLGLPEIHLPLPCESQY